MLYLFGGHSVEIVDKVEKETVYNDLWQLDLKTYQVRFVTARRQLVACSVKQDSVSMTRCSWTPKATR